MNSSAAFRFRASAVAWVMMFAAGCTSVPPTASNEGVTAQRTAPKVAKTPKVARTPKVAKSTARVEQNGAYGFTVHDVVRIGGDVRRDYQQAVALLETDQFQRGAELMETVIERAPEVTIPHIDLGMAYVQLGELEKAEASFRSALSLAPDHPVVLNELGILQRRTGRFDSARDSYERALASYPGFHYALLNLGVLCDLFLEDVRCALDNYSEYARIVGDDDQVGIWIADLENRLNQASGE